MTLDVPHVPALTVASIGMVTCGGLNALSACAAMRAHITRLEELAFHDTSGEPIVGAPAVEAVQGRQGYRRLGPLLCGALADCMTSSDHKSHAQILRSVPCLIVVGKADRSDYPADLGQLLIEELRAVFGVQDLHPLTRVIFAGVAGFFQALTHVRTLLVTEQSCLVACVDSLLNRRMLASLEQRRRLKTPANSDGVVPGEASAVLWLTTSRRGQTEIAQILGVGLAGEPAVLQPGQPNKAIGMTQAISNALRESGLSLETIDFRVAGITGERWDFVESSIAVARIQEVHKDEFLLWVPAEQIGDVGAALPACMAVAAIVGLMKGYTPGPRGLLFCASDDEKRGACVISRVSS